MRVPQALMIKVHSNQMENGPTHQIYGMEPKSGGRGQCGKFPTGVASLDLK